MRHVRSTRARIASGFGCLLLSLVLSSPGVAAGGNAVPSEALKHRNELTRNARLVWGLDAPVATFAAQIHQESLWRADAVSHAGAQGMAQFMPATARWMSELYPELRARDGPQPLNPAWAMRALVQFDHFLWQRHTAANACERMAFVLSAYNGGATWLERDRLQTERAGKDRDRWFANVELFNAGRSRPAFAENRAYPKRILLQHEPLYIAAGFGLGMCNKDTP